MLRALREPAMPSPRRRRQKHALVAFAESGGGALGEHPHVLGRRVVAWDGSTRPCPSCPACALPGPGGVPVPLLHPKLKIEKLRILPVFEE